MNDPHGISHSQDPGGSELLSLLQAQAQAWDQRPLLRRLYSDWYQAIVERLASVPGKSIELGSGIGRLRDHAGSRITLTDVEKTPWVDERVDALELPYADGSLANIVMLDVFHHLADPSRFLDEASRVLTEGGRLIMLEPYCSLVSTFLYKRFHQERTDLDTPPFEHDAATAKAPFESNQALTTLIFYRHRDEFRNRWPTLQLVEEKRLAFVLYPLSGGFSRRPLIPTALYGPLRLCEQFLKPLAPLLAFRCFLVLENHDGLSVKP